MRAEDHIRVRWALSQLLNASLEGLDRAFYALEVTLDEITSEALVPWDLINAETRLREAVKQREHDKVSHLAGQALRALNMGRAS